MFQQFEQCLATMMVEDREGHLYFQSYMDNYSLHLSLGLDIDRFGFGFSCVIETAFVDQENHDMMCIL